MLKFTEIQKKTHWFQWTGNISNKYKEEKKKHGESAKQLIIFKILVVVSAGFYKGFLT